MKRFVYIIIVFALVTSAVYAGGGGEGSGTPETLIFGDLTWDSALVHNQIAAFIIENGIGNYEVEFIPADTIVVFNGVVQGDIDIMMESWHSNYREAYDTGIATGEVVDLGKNLPDAPQGWWVPRYLVEGDGALAPNLSSIADLPQYWELFRDPEDPSKGIVYLGSAGWQSTIISENLFEEYGLGEWFNQGVPGSGAALAATMVGAYEQGEAWAGYYWAPTAILGRLDMVRLVGSEYEPADVHKLVNSSLLERAPNVVEFLRAYNTTVEVNNMFLAEKEANDWDAAETAQWFLENNEDVWTQWVSDEVAERVIDALN